MLLHTFHSQHHSYIYCLLETVLYVELLVGQDPRSKHVKI